MGDSESHLPVDAPDPAALSALLAGYDVQVLVAVGGMGAVYRARQVSLDREVAIKVLPRELAADEEFSKSFSAEAKAMARLTHPNLISVYDFGEVDGMFYLVMEFVEGDSLHAACHDQIVDPQQAVEIVRAVSAGLGVAHEEGIIHRDIKPANVFIGQDLVPKLGDFGLAVPSDDVASGLAMGTPGFVAPEVMQDGEAASAASDVFALGAMLHQMLSGITPTGEIEADMTLVPLAHGLRGLVQKALADDPAVRFQNGKEMAEALEGWLAKAKRGVAQMQAGAGAGGGAQWGQSVAVVGSAAAFDSSASGGSGGKVVAVLIMIAALVGVIWFVTSKGGEPEEGVDTDPPVAPAVPEKKPGDREVAKIPVKQPDMPPVEPDGSLTLEEIRDKYRTALGKARTDMIQERMLNLGRLKAEVGDFERWGPYLAMVDEETSFLPEYLTAEDVAQFEPSDLEVLDKFVSDKQAEIEDEHVERLEQLHRNFVKDMRKSELKLPSHLQRFREAWGEWLGFAALDLLGINLAGEWEQVHPREGGAVIRIDNRNGLTVVRNGIEVTGSDLLEFGENGKFVIYPNPEDRNQKWALNMRSYKLAGKDEDDSRVEFAMKPLEMKDYFEPGEAEDVVVKPPKVHVLSDPELVELNSKYLGAIERQVGPLVAAYRKSVKSALDLTRRRNDVRGVELMGLELVRLDTLGWESGCVFFDRLDWDSDVPLSHKGDKGRFDQDFKETMGKLQNFYIAELTKMKAKRQGDEKALGEVQSELQRFAALPEGAVRTRYIKLQAEEAEGVSHVALSELRFLDGEGELLPQDRLRIHGVSSAQVAEQEAKDRPPEHAIDGLPETLWHSRWKEPAAPWPHWIAIDLQEEQLITGFQLLPRREWMRIGDIVKWTLFTSRDGVSWVEAASGNFPKSQELKEYRFGEE